MVYHRNIDDCLIACIGPVTKKRIETYGLKCRYCSGNLYSGRNVKDIIALFKQAINRKEELIMELNLTVIVD